MNIVLKIISLTLINTIFSSCEKTEGSEYLFIPSTHQYVKYEGRTWVSDDNSKTQLIWSASTFSLSFKSEYISFQLEDAKGRNVYNVYIDGILTKRIKPNVTNDTFEFSNLENTWHLIKIVKCTEFNFGASSFIGFRIDKNGETRNTKKSDIRIEYYGDSITTGRDLEKEFLENETAKSSDITKAYSYLVADHFNADISVIARSGLGVIEGFLEENIFELYDLIDPLGTDKWNFDKHDPNVVIINLLQNDQAFIDKEVEEQLDINSDYFVKYREFVQITRSNYPDAHIVSMLGSMAITKEGSIWIDIMAQLVQEFNDPKLHFHVSPFKGTPGHPNENEHLIMSEQLIEFLKSNVIEE